MILSYKHSICWIFFGTKPAGKDIESFAVLGSINKMFFCLGDCIVFREMALIFSFTEMFHVAELESQIR